MTEDELRAVLRSELAPIKAQLEHIAPMRAQLDGLPISTGRSPSFGRTCAS